MWHAINTRSPLGLVLPSHGQFLLFCEGTRFTAQKHRVSMEVAEKKGLPTLKHHLLPRTKGFWITVQNLRGSGEAIILWSGDDEDDPIQPNPKPY